MKRTSTLLAALLFSVTATAAEMHECRIRSVCSLRLVALAKLFRGFAH
jgi:hypothetical protein